jgi:WD40 repeat protein
VNSISIKPDRPLRAVTGSDDNTVNFYHGVPFKFNKSLKDHSRFVQCVRYSPKGDQFFSAGSDSKLFLYDGKTGDLISEFNSVTDNHKGSIYSASWSPDSRQILSGSGDMTAKIWDVATQKVVVSYSFADKPTFENQQVGTLWSGTYLVTASLNGDINYIDPRTPPKPTRIIKGHQRGITALTVTNEKRIYSGSYDGRICSWELGVGGSQDIEGTGHSNQVISLGTDNSSVFSCGMDDSFRRLSIKESKYQYLLI